MVMIGSVIDLYILVQDNNTTTR